MSKYTTIKGEWGVTVTKRGFMLRVKHFWVPEGRGGRAICGRVKSDDYSSHRSDLTWATSTCKRCEAKLRKLEAWKCNHCDWTGKEPDRWVCDCYGCPEGGEHRECPECNGEVSKFVRLEEVDA
jgi:hypothetical protein